MKKTLHFTFILSLVTLSFQAQELNQSANWPNDEWSLSGSYDDAFLEADPTITGGASSFSFNDDAAGGPSINNVAVESPVIDLSNAFDAGENYINISFDYTLNVAASETLKVEYWDPDTTTWSNIGSALTENTATNDNFCSIASTAFTSEFLNIESFTESQLQNFKYRIAYNDNNSFGWGYCVDSPTIVSITPPACPSINTLSISGIMSTSANVNWNAGDDETSWEVAIALGTDTPPTSGELSSDNSYSLTDLTPETDYVVYVRANCLSDGYSNWVSKTFTTGFDNPSYPVSFTANPIATSGTYDMALVDLNGDFLDDIVSVSTTNINIHYQVATGGLIVIQLLPLQMP